MTFSDFWIAAGSLIVSTRCTVSQYEEFFDTTSLSHPLANDTILEFLSSSLGPVSELPTAIFVCISIGLIAWIYDIGKHEKLHAPMVILAFGLSVFFWIEFVSPVEIYLFVIFPWMLLVGLLISRIHSLVWSIEGLSASEGKRVNDCMLGYNEGLRFCGELWV
ncbi:hypothetical protein BCIN_13g00850 [Botrytis cinerea B05.10]|uniref:Uncharacterized protein n=1 Tax=Botryotinia fuckeliana (strain B05.10) TaxID=332648 RepID=A0A384K068_BOTFB|nr:hypothetical protein BCIN_13g00850 [Botrytis cinerea B05.10]ATZ56236.1 hypothetical protein BCIN_13g00850 [Botrytis cinerea B05.10]